MLSVQSLPLQRVGYWVDLGHPVGFSLGPGWRGDPAQYLYMPQPWSISNIKIMAAVKDL